MTELKLWNVKHEDYERMVIAHSEDGAKDEMFHILRVVEYLPIRWGDLDEIEITEIIVQDKTQLRYLLNCRFDTSDTTVVVRVIEYLAQWWKG